MSTETSKARALVRHLISAQIDNPDHIHLICPLTRSYELLLEAAQELFGQTAEEIRSRIGRERSAIESYRPPISEVERLREKTDGYERALNEIAYNYPQSAQEVARRAMGDDT